MKKRILFITKEYPAITSPTALAVSSVIEAMRKDYDVYCLALQTSVPVSKELEEHVFFLQKKSKKISPKFWSNFVFRLHQLLMSPFYPVFHPWQQAKLNHKALKICQQYHIDIVICVCFPFETIVSGSYIKKRLAQVKVVSYLIDAFACGTLPKYLPKIFAAFRKQCYEKKHIKNSDLIIAMESSKPYYQQQKEPFYRDIQYLNPAFMLPPQTQRASNNSIIQKGKINIVYTGYLYLPDRNPTYIIRLLSSLNNKNIRLIFIGRAKIGHIIEHEKTSFSGDLIQVDFLPHEQLGPILNEADVLLHLGVSNNNAISGKIFEYMAYGKPIMGIYFKQKEATLPYLAKYPLACCINRETTSFEGAKKQLADFLQKSVGKKVPYPTVCQLFYTSTPEAFCKVITQKFGV